MKYVVYLTMYKGTLLPRWYIGSSTIERVVNGYNGSVASKKWKEIYKKEQKENKELFTTRVLSYHKTKKDALEEECRVQRLHEVPKNEKYFNEAYASKNGFRGGDTSYAIDYDKIKENFDGSEHWRVINDRIKERRANSEEYNKWYIERRRPCRSSFLGKHHTENAKRAIAEKNSIRQSGKGNSQWGTHLYVDILSGERKRYKEGTQPAGWITTTEMKDKQKKKNGTYGRRWYNDGETNYFVFPNDPIVEEKKLIHKRL